MHSIDPFPVSVDSMPRPVGISLVAGGFGLIAAYLLCTGALVGIGRLPLASGAPLLNGMETMGPLIFFICAALASVTALGLLRMNRWARRAASILVIALFVTAIPAISSAVIDMRIVAIAREGLRIILAVVAFRYLNLEAVRDAFTARIE